MANWWDSGPGAVERAEKREEESRARQSSTSPRVWQKPGAKTTITLISDDLIFFTEHMVKLGEKEWGRFVCLEGAKTPDGKRDIPCPFCKSKLAGKQEHQVLVGTCINHTGFKTKEGGTIEHVKQVLVLKGTAKTMFLKEVGSLKKQYGENFSYVWSVWEVEREAKEKSPTPGILWDCKGMRPKEKLIKIMKAAGKEIEDWDLYLKPRSIEDVSTYLEPEAAYRLDDIPFPTTFVPLPEAPMAAAEEQDYEDVEFPPTTPGREQPINFAMPEDEPGREPGDDDEEDVVPF